MAWRYSLRNCEAWIQTPNIYHHWALELVSSPWIRVATGHRLIWQSWKEDGGDKKNDQSFRMLLIYGDKQTSQPGNDRFIKSWIAWRKSGNQSTLSCFNERSKEYPIKQSSSGFKMSKWSDFSYNAKVKCKPHCYRMFWSRHINRFKKGSDKFTDDRPIRGINKT